MLFTLQVTHTVWFENKYLIPNIGSQNILPYRTIAYDQLCDEGESIRNSVTIQPFWMTADEAYKQNFNRGGKNNIGLFEIYGTLDLQILEASLMEAGIQKDSIIKSELLAADASLPIQLNGRIDAAGFLFNISHYITDNFSCGWSSGLFNLRSIIRLTEGTTTIKNEQISKTEGYINELLSAYREINNLNDITTSLYETGAMADNELYLRYDFARDYYAYLRRLKGSLQGGVLLPTAPREDIDQIASIPAGSNKHVLGYIAGQIDLVLKEDVTFSILGRLLGGLDKTIEKRLPLLTEPQRFGTTKALIDVNPGLTYHFAPELSVEGLREGLGAKISYSVTRHLKDSWNLVSTEFKNENLLLHGIDMGELTSEWSQEHFNISIFYDFMRNYCKYTFEPFIGIKIQIPVDWMSSRGSAQAYGLSFIIEAIY